MKRNQQIMQTSLQCDKVFFPVPYWDSCAPQTNYAPSVLAPLTLSLPLGEAAQASTH